MSSQVSADVVLVRPNTDHQYHDQIWDLLVEVDQEFVPPLSARETTTDRNLGTPATQKSLPPRQYFAGLLAQHSLLAVRNGTLTGLMSFIARHDCPAVPDLSPCTYISTIAVRRAARRSGIGRLLYEQVCALPPELASSHLVTRTWSTNDLHLPLLTAVGFTLALRIEDDRGAGIDSMYLARSV